MTRYTPYHNWPVAEDNDVVKQYPSIVDGPFKDAMQVFVPTLVEFGEFEVALAWPDPFLGRANGGQIRIGTYAPTSDSAGYAQIVFNTPMPTNTKFALVSVGDQTNALQFKVAANSYSPTGFAVMVILDGGGLGINTACRVNFLAIGH